MWTVNERQVQERTEPQPGEGRGFSSSCSPSGAGQTCCLFAVEAEGLVLSGGSQKPRGAWRWAHLHGLLGELVS